MLLSAQSENLFRIFIFYFVLFFENQSFFTRARKSFRIRKTERRYRLLKSVILSDSEESHTAQSKFDTRPLQIVHCHWFVQILRTDEVTASPLPFYRFATFSLIGKSSSVPTRARIARPYDLCVALRLCDSLDLFLFFQNHTACGRDVDERGYGLSV